jgi:hypothetical protein
VDKFVAVVAIVLAVAVVLGRLPSLTRSRASNRAFSLQSSNPTIEGKIKEGWLLDDDDDFPSSFGVELLEKERVLERGSQ